MWRALRYGLDGRLLDLEAPVVEEFPAAEPLDRLKAWSGGRRSAARAQRRPAPAPHDRRRRDPEEVYAECVKETGDVPGGDRHVSTQEPQRPVQRGGAARHRGRDAEDHGRRRAAADHRHAAQRRRPQGGARQPPPAEGEAAPEPDLEQVRQAIEGARALLPLVEARHKEQLGPVRDALSQLQMFYAQRSGGQPPPPEGTAARPSGRRPGTELRAGSGFRGSRPSRPLAVNCPPSGGGPGLAVAFRFDLTQRGSPCPTS